MSTQFNVLSGDLLCKTVDDTDMVAMIAAICAIESEHPGTLSMVFRLCALAGDGFSFQSKCSAPDRSYQVQLELDRWLREFSSQLDDTLSQSYLEGGKLV